VHGGITDEALERLRRGVEIRLPASRSRSRAEKEMQQRQRQQRRQQQVEENQEMQAETVDDRGGSSSASSSTYTTLPCKARRLDTVTVEQIIETNKEAIEIGIDNNEMPEKTTNNKKKKKKKKNKSFGGACNICGNAGHKARDCDQNPRRKDIISQTTIINQRNNHPHCQKTNENGRSCSTTRRQHCYYALPPRIPPPSPKKNHPLTTSPHSARNTTWIALTITEGKYRQVRKMTAAVGHPTLRLVRVRIGNVTLDGMSCGEVRSLEDSEACMMSLFGLTRG